MQSIIIHNIGWDYWWYTGAVSQLNWSLLPDASRLCTIICVDRFLFLSGCEIGESEEQSQSHSVCEKLLPVHWLVSSNYRTLPCSTGGLCSWQSEHLGTVIGWHAMYCRFSTGDLKWQRKVSFPTYFLDWCVIMSRLTPRRQYKGESVVVVMEVVHLHLLIWNVSYHCWLVITDREIRLSGQSSIKYFQTKWKDFFWRLLVWMMNSFPVESL